MRLQLLKNAPACLLALSMFAVACNNTAADSKNHMDTTHVSLDTAGKQAFSPSVDTLHRDSSRPAGQK